jgi:hypothetical protein
MSCIHFLQQRKYELEPPRPLSSLTVLSSPSVKRGWLQHPLTICAVVPLAIFLFLIGWILVSTPEKQKTKRK